MPAAEQPEQIHLEGLEGLPSWAIFVLMLAHEEIGASKLW